MLPDPRSLKFSCFDEKKKMSGTARKKSLRIKHKNRKERKMTGKKPEKRVNEENFLSSHDTHDEKS